MKHKLHLSLIGGGPFELDQPIYHHGFVVFKSKKDIDILLQVKYNNSINGNRSKVALEEESVAEFNYHYLDLTKISTDCETFLFVEKENVDHKSDFKRDFSAYLLKEGRL